MLIEAFSKLKFAQVKLNFNFAHVVGCYLVILLLFHKKQLLGEKSFLEKAKDRLFQKNRKRR